MGLKVTRCARGASGIQENAGYAAHRAERAKAADRIAVSLEPVITEIRARGTNTPTETLADRRIRRLDCSPATIDLMPARGFEAYGGGCAASSPAPYPSGGAREHRPEQARLVLPPGVPGPRHSAAIIRPRSGTPSPKFAAPTQRNLGTP